MRADKSFQVTASPERRQKDPTRRVGRIEAVREKTQAKSSATRVRGRGAATNEGLVRDNKFAGRISASTRSTSEPRGRSFVYQNSKVRPKRWPNVLFRTTHHICDLLYLEYLCRPSLPSWLCTSTRLSLHSVGYRYEHESELRFNMRSVRLTKVFSPPKQSSAAIGSPVSAVISLPAENPPSSGSDNTDSNKDAMSSLSDSDGNRAQNEHGNVAEPQDPSTQGLRIDRLIVAR